MSEKPTVGGAVALNSLLGELTSGPWHACQPVGPALAFAVESDAEAVAVVQGHGGKRGFANAKLIAAAPELLHALICLREQFGAPVHESGDALTQAERAIAQALGLPPNAALSGKPAATEP